MSTVHTKFYCASGPTDSRLLSSRRFSLPRCLLCLSLSLELYCFFHLVHSILLVIRAFFYYLATIDRSRSVCPHLHETVLQDLTLEDRDSVEVSHEFRNRLLTELHRRFEQINSFQSASNTNTFRNARGHREKEWTDFDEVSAIAFGGEKIPTCRNRVNLINGRQTKRLSVQLPALSTLSTWDVWRCSSQGVCKYARKL